MSKSVAMLQAVPLVIFGFALTIALIARVMFLSRVHRGVSSETSRRRGTAEENGDQDEVHPLIRTARAPVLFFNSTIWLHQVIPADQSWRELRQMIAMFERDAIAACGPELAEACREAASHVRTYLELPTEEDLSADYVSRANDLFNRLDELAEARGLSGPESSARALHLHC